MKRLVVASCVLLVASTALVLRSRFVRSGEETLVRRQKAVSQNENTLKEQKAFEARLAAAEAKRAELRGVLSRTNAEQKDPASAATSRQRILSMDTVIDSSPEAQASMVDWQRAFAQLRYASFFASRGLSTELRDKLCELEAKRYEVMMDLRGAQAATGVDTSAEMEKVRAQAELDTLSLLGPQTTSELKKYNQTMSLRQLIVAPLAGQLAVAGLPITAQQGEELVNLLATSSGKRGGRVTVDDVNWETALVNARAVLQPAQLAALEAQAAEEQANRKIWSLLRQWRKTDQATKK